MSLLLPAVYCHLAWCHMGLMDSEAGKRRLLTVEIPVIEKYNEGRDPLYKIQVVRQSTSLVLRYRLKPGHNIYQLETRLVSSYPTVPPEIRICSKGKLFACGARAVRG